MCKTWPAIIPLQTHSHVLPRMDNVDGRSPRHVKTCSHRLWTLGLVVKTCSHAIYDNWTLESVVSHVLPIARPIAWNSSPASLCGLSPVSSYVTSCSRTQVHSSDIYSGFCRVINPYMYTYFTLFTSVFTARCTLVQSAVLRSHVVCLSVYDVGELWSHRLEFFENNFFIS